MVGVVVIPKYFIALLLHALNAFWSVIVNDKIHKKLSTITKIVVLEGSKKDLLEGMLF
jgi:hypothetical protein